MDFTATLAAFDENFHSRNELGASVAVWKDGELALNHAKGWTTRTEDTAWTTETLVPIYSATKGLAACCILHALDEMGRDLDTEMHLFWPTFGQPHLTIGELLSHQSGLAGLDQKVSIDDYDAVIRALETQEPAWEPPAHGYHPRTYGFLLDEVIRRITTAHSLGDYWRQQIAAPNDLDLWIGLPESEFPRVATLYPGKMTSNSAETEFYKAFNDSNSPTRKAFSNPRGLQSVAEMNEPRAWQLGLPAMGGVGTAAALATFYGRVAVGELFSERILHWLQTPQVNGMDKTLLMPTCFAAGVMMDPTDDDGKKLRQTFGPSKNAFGHPGAGGSHAFADPDAGIGFGYVMNQMELGVLPNEKALSMVSGLYSDLGSANVSP